MTYRKLITWSYTLALSFAAGVVLWQLTTPARAHSWYPKDCCSGDDCAVVLKIEQTREGRLVTTKHGTVLVPPTFTARPSEDNDFHACMAPSDGMYGDSGPALICWFEPSGS